MPDLYHSVLHELFTLQGHITFKKALAEVSITLIGNAGILVSLDVKPDG